MNSITPNPSKSQQSNVTNWKEIDLSDPYRLRLIQRAIAERLGYKAHYDDELLGWHILSPDNKQVTLSYASAEYAWGSALSWKIHDYASDANAALELVADIAEFRTLKNHNSWNAWIYQHSDRPGYHGRALTLAMAICLAWLAWQDANGGNHG